MSVPTNRSPLISVYPQNGMMANRTITAEKLLIYVDPVHLETENNEIFLRFRNNSFLRSIPVVKLGKPVGLINRYNFIDRFAQLYQRELLGSKPCSQTMYDQPLLVEKNTTIQELSKLLAECESCHFVDGLIVTDEGYYLGVATGQDLLRSITQMQIEDFRIAATAFESREGMLITDANSTIIRVNSAFTDITGYTVEDVIGKSVRMLSSGRQDFAFYAAMWKSISDTGAWEGEIWNRRKNNEVYPAHLIITAVKDTNSVVTNYVASLSDITQRKQADEEIRHLAFYDKLTGLPNRQLLLNRLQHSLASSARSGKEGALMFIDLDNFKTINDTLGHGMGDLMLQQVAQRLTSCMREGDTVSRVGGDEFVVLLEDLSEQAHMAAEQTRVVGEKILAAINQPYQLATQKFRITTSIGAALFSNNPQSIDELMKQADIAMYQAKKAGRNTLRFFDPQMQAAVNTRAALESDLRKALEHQQFQLHYQIQVDSMNRPLGAETLIRWLHPKRGFVSPAQFIPLAEENGLILPMGLWVLETACAQLKVWEQDALTRDLALSVNVSARQFHQADFAAQVQAAVQRHAINPKLLKLELTESMLVEDVEKIIVTMNTLKETGIQFSMDDFGTGYSSLQYLKRLPLAQLKIDRSFIRDMAVDASDNSIVQTIIAMAKSLNLNVIAEGVETEEQRQLLAFHGCQHYQGYLFGKPVPVAQFEALLKTGMIASDVCANTERLLRSKSKFVSVAGLHQHLPSDDLNCMCANFLRSLTGRQLA